MKIICIGRNYKDHAKEMAQPIPDVPMFFLKPDSALLPKRNPFPSPSVTLSLLPSSSLTVKDPLAVLTVIRSSNNLCNSVCKVLIIFV